MIEILVALISGGLTLVGVICTNAAANRRIAAKIQTAQAVTDTKLESLTHEVRQHNHFCQPHPRPGGAGPAAAPSAFCI